MCSYNWDYISRVNILITHITGLTTPLITTHEPPSTVVQPYISTRAPSFEHGSDLRDRASQ